MAKKCGKFQFIESFLNNQTDSVLQMYKFLFLVTPVDCGNITAPDQIGPFFREEAHLDYKIAPAAELSDKKTATVLTGKVILTYCHTRINLGFSANLRIWQVSSLQDGATTQPIIF